MFATASFSSMLDKQFAAQLTCVDNDHGESGIGFVRSQRATLQGRGTSLYAFAISSCDPPRKQQQRAEVR
eukprot:762863-Hanusia_phi.AAC.1